MSSTSSTSGLSTTGLNILSGFNAGASALGINVSSLVSGLVSASSGPLNNLKTQLTTNQSQISAYGSIQSSLASLYGATQNLYGVGSAITAQNVSSTATAVATATSDGTAVTGSHTINVTQLAETQSLTSAGFSTTDFTFNGSLSIKVGSGSATNVTIASGSSLADVVKDINNANTGVNASIVNDGTQNHLVLTSANSGTANAFTVTGTDTTGSNLSTLNWNATSTAANTNTSGTITANGSPNSSYLSYTTPLNAALTIDGIATTEPSNTVSTALQGITLNLSSLGTSTLNISLNTSAIDNAVSTFVSYYNNNQSTLRGLTAYDTTTKTAGVLNGDVIPNSLQNQLGGMLSTTFSQMSTGLGSAYQGTGSFTSLADLGVSLNSDGTLSLDTAKLNTAVASNPTGALAGFSNFGQTLNKFLDAQLNTTHGTIATATTTLKSQAKLITDQETAMQAHLDALQAQYTAQFTALQTVLSQMSSTSSYLNAQFTAMSNSR